MTLLNKNELYINGMTNKVDTINSIIDNIDDNDLDTAKDSLNQSKEVEEIKNDEDMLQKTSKVIEKLQSFATEEITEDVLSTVLRTQSLVEEIYNGDND